MSEKINRPPSERSNFGLGGQTALITGATGGFGRRMCKVLAAYGANVAICARQTDRMEELTHELQAAGGKCCAFKHDVHYPPAPLFDEIEHRLGQPVSILINNAGIGHADQALDCPLATFEHVLAVDLIAPFRLAQEATRRMLMHRIGGAIVNVASIFGQTPSKSMVAYAVAKAGLIQLTKCLALEWGGKGIRVNAIAPGWSMTPMTEAYLQSERGATIAADIPLGRFGHPADLDGAVLLLCSDLGRYINGAVLTIDGGLSVGMREGRGKPKPPPASALVTPEELGVAVSVDY